MISMFCKRRGWYVRYIELISLNVNFLCVQLCDNQLLDFNHFHTSWYLNCKLTTLCWSHDHLELCFASFSLLLCSTSMWHLFKLSRCVACAPPFPWTFAPEFHHIAVIQPWMWSQRISTHVRPPPSELLNWIFGVFKISCMTEPAHINHCQHIDLRLTMLILSIVIQPSLRPHVWVSFILSP